MFVKRVKSAVLRRGGRKATEKEETARPMKVERRAGGEGAQRWKEREDEETS